jgi:hypothetical protein
MNRTGTSRARAHRIACHSGENSAKGQNDAVRLSRPGDGEPGLGGR